MTAVAVLTPDPEDKTYHRSWPEVLDRLIAALSRAGMEARPEPWTLHAEDAAGLRPYPLILPLLAWGYHRDAGRWLDACAVWQAAGLPFANPASVIAWNTDKSYLRRLDARGVAIAPTVWLDEVDAQVAEQARAALGGGTVIVKPRISGGAWRTEKLAPGERLLEPLPAPALIQPFLPSIESEGELSLLFFDGRFSHAVRKRPAAGDFRIQVQFGGDYRSETPPDDARALADQALSSVDEPLLYARVDMVRGGDGRWLLMELELIEPDFYLGQAPDRGAAFVEAVRRRL